MIPKALARLASFLSLLSAPANDEVLSLLTRDGGEIAFGELAPGLIELTSESAFPVLKDSKGGPVAAAGEALDGNEPLQPGPKGGERAEGLKKRLPAVSKTSLHVPKPVDLKKQLNRAPHPVQDKPK